MGNSASNSKDKKKKKRTLPSKDKNNDDDEEWEYEYEYLEVDEAPANIKSGISALAKSNFQKPTKNQGLKRNSRPLKQNFDQFKKPIRNSLKFVRNYANILHKFYVNRCYFRSTLGSPKMKHGSGISKQRLPIIMFLSIK